MKIKADGYFAIIPEWVLYADISPAAVRVYAVLNRYANDNGKCVPSRKSIAEKAKIGLSSVDRSIDELVKIGAVLVKHRTTKEGDPTSNEYTVIMNRGLPTENRPLIGFEQTGLSKSDNQTIASMNQSQESDTSSDEEVKEKPLDEVIAALWWESRQKKPLGKNAWWSLRNVVKAALDRDYTPEEITDALNGYGTVPSLAAFDIRLQKIRPRSIREERMAEMFEYAQTATHNPFDAQPAQKELNP